MASKHCGVLLLSCLWAPKGVLSHKSIWTDRRCRIHSFLQGGCHSSLALSKRGSHSAHGVCQTAVQPGPGWAPHCPDLFCSRIPELLGLFFLPGHSCPLFTGSLRNQRWLLTAPVPAVGHCSQDPSEPGWLLMVREAKPGWSRGAGFVFLTPMSSVCSCVPASRGFNSRLLPAPAHLSAVWVFYDPVCLCVSYFWDDARHWLLWCW